MAGAKLERRKRILVVLFVPSRERDGLTEIDQEFWVEVALKMFGQIFGGATAYPRARGIWRDDERGGALVRDHPVVIHCYTTPEALKGPKNIDALSAFCHRMGRDTHQGEVGLILDDEYIAISHFEEG